MEAYMEGKKVKVHLGGSWRKWQRQKAEFERAGIELTWLHGTFSGHYSNGIYLMADTPEARAVLKKAEGSVCRDQGPFKNY
jgi:hypothetical protein